MAHHTVNLGSFQDVLENSMYYSAVIEWGIPYVADELH